MTPVLNNHLNELVKKKVVIHSGNSNGGFNSNSASPKTMSVYDGDGTSGQTLDNLNRPVYEMNG